MKCKHAYLCAETMSSQTLWIFTCVTATYIFAHNPTTICSKFSI